MKPGDLIDQRYKILSVLGQGGMGQVFLCYDENMDRKVAIKVLLGTATDQVMKRFHTEARALAQIPHPNIMEVFDFGQAENGHLFLVMAYLKGESLSDLIERRGQQTFFDVLPIFERICQGLRFAHKNNILHRDIKPSNVMLAEDRSENDSVKLVDFGLAKQVENSQELTKTGSAMGSPPYMSPESIHGTGFDERSDIYSLGCTLFEMIAARPPFEGETPFHTMMAQINRLAPSLSEVCGKEIDGEIEDFIRKCMAKSPENRFQDMDEVIAELDRITTVLIERREASRSAGEWASSVYNSSLLMVQKNRNAVRIFVGLAAVVITGGAGFGIWNWYTSSHHQAPEAGGEGSDISNIRKAGQNLSTKSVDSVVVDKMPDQGQGVEKFVEQKPWGPMISCKAAGTFTDAALIEEAKKCRDVQILTLENIKAGEKGILSFAEIPVFQLKLVAIPLTRDLFTRIGQNPNLKLLIVQRCGEIPPQFLDELQQSKSLGSIQIETGRNVGQALALARMKSLVELELGGFDLTRQDMKAFTAVPNLFKLVVSNGTLEPDTFKDFKKQNLRTLSLQGCEIYPANIDDIADLHGLISLDLQRTTLSDDLLMKLAALTELTELNVMSTDVGPEAVQKLKAKLPKLKKVMHGLKRRDDVF